MKRIGKCALIGILAATLVCVATSVRADPLPSWNGTAPKKAIVAFVGKVTKKGSPDHVPPTERIAVFDSDGTLWAGQPMYFQLMFALDA
ncbi:MAG: nonspecific acid phosphatase precursor [Deltaproteobacteria bacterium]|nr:nonspecific acid phosphatase precursor [Deltaproteobacteria bacterium]